MSCVVYPNTVSQQQLQQHCDADGETIYSVKPDVVLVVEEEGQFSSPKQQQQQEHSNNNDNNNNNTIHPSELSFGPITKENIDELRKINVTSFPVQYNERFYKDIIYVNDCELNKFVYYKNHIVGALSCRYETIKSTATTKNEPLSTSLEDDLQSTAAMTITSKRRKLTNVLANINNENSNYTDNNTVKDNHTRKDQIDKHNMEQSHIEGKRLYIMTLAVVASFRGMGIGTYLFQSVLNHCQRYNDSIRQQQHGQHNVSIDNYDRESSKKGSSNDYENANTTTTTTTTKSLLIQQVLLHVQISNIDAINFYSNHFNFKRGVMVQNYYRRIDPPHCYVLYKNIDGTTMTSTNTDCYDDDDNKEN